MDPSLVPTSGGPSLHMMDPSLYEAATSGDFSFLRRMIDGDRSKLLLQTPKENTILHIAAEFKQIDFVKEVIVQSPLLLWWPNSKGDTPLHVAARVGCHEVVEFLINHTRTLHEVERGGIDSCKELLQMTNKEMDTALHVAVRNGHLHVVILLMEADPELSCSVNSANEFPLALATKKGFPDIARHILLSPSPFPGTNGGVALRTAITSKLRGIVEIMVSKYPDMIKEKDTRTGFTPLHFAACNGELEATRLLMQYDSSAAYLLDNDGNSALYLAALKGRMNVIEELIRCRPDTCDLLNKNGRTALHAAILGGQEKVVKYILKTPKLVSLINEPDKDGNTPLHQAAISGSYSLISMLARDSRVDKTATNKKNLKAIDVFLQNPREERVSYEIKKVLHFLGSPSNFLAVELRTKAVELRTDKDIWEERRSMVDTHLVVAMLIATVTFAAAFTMPGGYKSEGRDQGMPNLIDKTAFKVFVIFDTISFFLSSAAVYLQFYTAAYFNGRLKFANVTILLILLAILGMFLAFASGIYVVLAINNFLAILVSVMCALFFSILFFHWFVDPSGMNIPFLRWPRKYFWKLLFHYNVSFNWLP